MVKQEKRRKPLFLFLLLLGGLPPGLNRMIGTELSRGVFAARIMKRSRAEKIPNKKNDDSESEKAQRKANKRFHQVPPI
jgi:hypothetical protein